MSERSARSLELLGVGIELRGRRVLEGVTLVAAAGAPVGITGPSGSGKSVLCLLAAGVMKPTTGALRFAGLPFPDEAAVTRAIVLQTHGLIGGLTAAENVALPLQVRDMSRSEVLHRARSVLEAVGLGEQTERSVEELSGGERQRVGIARALAGDPDVMVADEPTAELDAGNRARVLNLLVEQARRGSVVLVASDDPEVLKECGSIYRLRGQ